MHLHISVWILWKKKSRENPICSRCCKIWWRQSSSHLTCDHIVCHSVCILCHCLRLFALTFYLFIFGRFDCADFECIKTQNSAVCRARNRPQLQSRRHSIRFYRSDTATIWRWRRRHRLNSELISNPLFKGFIDYIRILRSHYWELFGRLAMSCK